VLSRGSKVKLKNVNLIRLLGTVIFQIQRAFCGKLFGKLGLATNPLDAPVRAIPPEAQAAKKNTKQ